jgi:3-oxoacyl-[acyl-carrier protein] reductase
LFIISCNYLNNKPVSMKKVFLIVGSSKGIGEQIAKQIIAKGDEVIGMSRSPHGGVSRHYVRDILTDELPALDGVIDGIVYCPGSINLKPFRALKPDDYRNDFELNTVGAIKVLQQYLPSLQKSEGASVVLFSTVAVQTGMPFHASVAASKGAIEGLTRSLAAEWAPKIRVNCIAPSLTDTPLAARLLDSDAKRQSSEQRHPLKRIGDSNHVAAMACFLLGNDADFITGQVIKVDGGMSSIRL